MPVESRSPDARAPRRFLTLRFADPGLESEFRRDAAREMLPTVRAGNVLGVGVWAGAALLGPRAGLVDARLDIALPALMITANLIQIALLRSDDAGRWIVAFGFEATLVNAASVLIIGRSAPAFAPFVVPSLVVVAIYTFVVYRLPLVAGLSASLLVLVAYLVVKPAPSEPVIAGFDVLLIATAVALGAAASHLLERSSRERFLQRRLIEGQAEELARERAKSDALLANVLPAVIAARLRDDPSALAERYDAASVLFADLVGFTALAERLGPPETARVLNLLFSRFDAVVGATGLEKIKTIGDGYMAVAGVPEPSPDHAARAVEAGLRILIETQACAGELGLPLALRIGVHSGPVVAGVIGTRRLSYDLWGDTVNTASRMESSGVPGRIQVTESIHAALRDRYRFEDRGLVEVKGKAPLHAYLVVAASVPTTGERGGR